MNSLGQPRTTAEWMAVLKERDELRRENARLRSCLNGITMLPTPNKAVAFAMAALAKQP